MFNVKRTVYGTELYLGIDRLCTCDNVEKVERLIVWLSALNSLMPLAQVLEARKAQLVKPTPTPKEEPKSE